MTYAQFLALFLVVPIVLLLFIVRRRLTVARLASISGLMLVALVYTTPWDNYLVANRIWWYASNQVIGLTLGWVPIEEYTFFLLQPLATGLLLLAWWPAGSTSDAPAGRGTAALVLTGLTSALWALGVLMLAAGPRSLTYLGLELAWALPPLILQLLFGADLILSRWKPAVVTLVLSTLFLVAADMVAIGAGIWTISPDYTLGVNPHPALVFEEVVFFILTNALVIGGLTLLWHPHSAARWRRLSSTWLDPLLHRSSSDPA